MTKLFSKLAVCASLVFLSSVSFATDYCAEFPPPTRADVEVWYDSARQVLQLTPEQRQVLLGRISVPLTDEQLLAWARNQLNTPIEQQMLDVNEYTSWYNNVCLGQGDSGNGSSYSCSKDAFGDFSCSNGVHCSGNAFGDFSCNNGTFCERDAFGGFHCGH